MKRKTFLKLLGAGTIGGFVKLLLPWYQEGTEDGYFTSLKRAYVYVSEQTGIHNQDVILVDGQTQKLFLLGVDNNEVTIVREYTISTSRNGFGSTPNSYKTPTGVHVIDRKIGDGQPLGAVFIGRVPTGEIATIIPTERHNEEGLITTRILWLDGKEEHNRTSKRRFIYIHGTQLEGNIGRPISTGCVNMKNKDIIELFALVQQGTRVAIYPSISELFPSE